MLRFLFVFMITSSAIFVVSEDEVIEFCSKPESERNGVLMMVFVSSGTYFLKYTLCNEKGEDQANPKKYER